LGLATKGRLNVGYGSFRYTAQDTNSAWGTVGIEHNFHELWTVIVDLGGRFARTKYQVQELQFVPPFFMVPVTVDKTSEVWSGVGKASVNYKGRRRPCRSLLATVAVSAERRHQRTSLSSTSAGSPTSFGSPDGLLPQLAAADYAPALTMRPSSCQPSLRYSSRGIGTGSTQLRATETHGHERQPNYVSEALPVSVE
jgi:hypothetical protein